MEKILKMRQGELANHAEYALRKQGRVVYHDKGSYVYSPGEIPMMIVAHLDTVHGKPVKTVCRSSDGRILMSPEGIGGDDRCGVYIALEASKRIRPSILFTYDEEVGGLGVRKFCKDYRYQDLGVKFIIEFDKAGNDVVTYYNQEAPEFMDFIEEHTEYSVTHGSYSDIVDLYQEFGIACGNFSAGYFNQHTTHETIDMLGVARGIDTAVHLGKLSAEEATPFFESEHVPVVSYLNSYDEWPMEEEIVAEVLVLDWETKEEYTIALPERYDDDESRGIIDRLFQGDPYLEMVEYAIYPSELHKFDDGNLLFTDVFDLVTGYLYDVECLWEY